MDQVLFGAKQIQMENSSILLASSSQELSASWERGTEGFIQVSCADNLDTLRDDLVRIKPSILLLDHDLPGLIVPSGIAALIKLSPETRVIVLSNPIADEIELELFKAGVKGCCPKNIDAKHIKNVISAVRQGELWMRRSLTFRLLKEMTAIASKRNKIKHVT
jgi:DNA-binding NarL/FixJ family response regulator